MNERDFIASIDCRFPYEDELEWKRIVEHGARLSPNAAFMVLLEICRVPASALVEPDRLAAIFSYWQSRFSHPLVEVVLPAAKALVEGYDLPVEECARMMRQVGRYPGEYNALSIPYFACDDQEGRIEEIHEAIKESWRAP